MVMNYKVLKGNDYALILNMRYQKSSSRVPVGTEVRGKVRSQVGGIWNGV